MSSAIEILPSKVKIGAFLQRNPMGTLVTMTSLLTCAIISSIAYGTAAHYAESTVETEKAKVSGATTTGALFLSVAIIGSVGAAVIFWMKGGGMVPKFSAAFGSRP